jgi:hypothetical protein
MKLYQYVIADTLSDERLDWGTLQAPSVPRARRQLAEIARLIDGRPMKVWRWAGTPMDLDTLTEEVFEVELTPIEAFDGNGRAENGEPHHFLLQPQD